MTEEELKKELYRIQEINLHVRRIHLKQYTKYLSFDMKKLKEEEDRFLKKCKQKVYKNKERDEERLKESREDVEFYQKEISRLEKEIPKYEKKENILLDKLMKLAIEGKTKRCPIGYRRNKKTKRCDKV